MMMMMRILFVEKRGRKTRILLSQTLSFLFAHLSCFFLDCFFSLRLGPWVLIKSSKMRDADDEDRVRPKTIQSLVFFREAREWTIRAQLSYPYTVYVYVSLELSPWDLLSFPISHTESGITEIHLDGNHFPFTNMNSSSRPSNYRTSQE